MPDPARCCLTHYLQQGYKDNDIYGVMAYPDNSKISYDLKKLI